MVVLGIRLIAAKRIALRLVKKKMSMGKEFYPSPEWIDKDLRKFRKTKRPCSCWMCGNPRKYFGEPTVQERRAWDIGDYDSEMDL
jgi:hypothetical protein